MSQQVESCIITKEINVRTLQNHLKVLRGCAQGHFALLCFEFVSRLMLGIISMHGAIRKLYLLGNGRFRLVEQ